MDYLGVDIAKKSFDVALLGAQQTVQGHFSNDKAGWGKLLRWLQKRKAADLQVGMEATGRYWEGLAYFLHEQGFAVSVLNPRIIKSMPRASCNETRQTARMPSSLLNSSPRSIPRRGRRRQPPFLSCRHWSATCKRSRATASAS